MSKIEFDGKNFAEKILLEGTPGFVPTMYRHINESGTINWRAAAKDVYRRDHARDELVLKLPQR